MIQHSWKWDIKESEETRQYLAGHWTEKEKGFPGELWAKKQ